MTICLGRATVEGRTQVNVASAAPDTTTARCHANRGDPACGEQISPLEQVSIKLIGTWELNASDAAEEARS